MFDAEFKTCGDYEMWLRMAAMDQKFRYLPQALTYYRYHGKNNSKKTTIMHNDRVKAMQKIFALNFLSTKKQQLKSIGLAAVYRQGANSFFSDKRYDEFLKNAKLAFSLNPGIINSKFVTRFLRSWIFTKILKK